MSEHLQLPFLREIENNEKIIFPSEDNTKTQPKLIDKLRYYFSLSILGAFFILVMPPIMLWAKIKGNREAAYPGAKWGAETWMRWSGMKIKVRGRENLAPNQGYIFVANHRSYLDTSMMFAYTGKKMGVIAKKEMLNWFIAGKFMKYVNVIAIDRSNAEAAIETIRNASEKLCAGVSFGIFAEGTRAFPNELLPFKKGAFHMAIDTGVPIVPVAMKNTDYAMGKKQGMARAATCEMVLLPPVETKGLTAERDLPNLLKKVRGAIARELAIDSGQRTMKNGQ